MYNTSLHFHFTGVGGTGMSGLAEVLMSLGFAVSGSDLAAGPTVERLRGLGATISEGHAARNVPLSASLLVYSSAVPADNPELAEARRRGLPVIRRAEVLAELVRLKYGVVVAGSHGKTTTTSLVSWVLTAAGLDPTVILGGQVLGGKVAVDGPAGKGVAGGGVRGEGAFLVAESDESDRSFLLLRPTIAVVTNIDAEHLSAYGSMEDLERSFALFVSSVPFYGLAVLCADDPRVRDLARAFGKRKVLYGLSEDADVRGADLRFGRGTSSFDVWAAGGRLFRATIGVPGAHLVTNALAAVAVALELSVPPEVIKTALESFPGVARRSEVVGSAGGVTVVSDYGHHPTEVGATLGAVRECWVEPAGRLVVVFQPHRYSRTVQCFDAFLTAFGPADVVYVTDVYAAGEDPVPSATGRALAGAMKHPDVRFLGPVEASCAALKGETRPGDVVLFLGAGSIGAEALRFASFLRAPEAAVCG